MEKTSLLSEEKIVNRIYLIRGKKVMLDRDLAEMYGVVTGNLNKAVKRNLRRFPDDFMFRLTVEEFENLKSQFVTSSSGQKDPNLIFQSGISSLKGKVAWGGTRILPYVFTEQGIAMLSSVLNSDTAIDVNIQIIRVFTRIREVLLSQKEMVLKIEKLEKKVLEQNSKVGQHDEEIRRIFLVLKQFIKTNSEPMKKVGYKRKNE
ncbi:MAG TPA: ORF6N domain-containing protein [Bacteroidia bacterium]|nr:ORF6N domain-containing protein [Bacteroidia bacterium]